MAYGIVRPIQIWTSFSLHQSECEHLNVFKAAFQLAEAVLCHAGWGYGIAPPLRGHDLKLSTGSSGSLL